MRKITLNAETLLVESFETLGESSEVRGTVRGHDAYTINLSGRFCSACCPQTLAAPADAEW